MIWELNGRDQTSLCLAIDMKHLFVIIRNITTSRTKIKFESLRKVDLPVGCNCIQRLLPTREGDLQILSEAGVLWFWMGGCEDIKYLKCLEPVFKIVEERLLSVTGSLHYRFGSDKTTHLVLPNTKFTDSRELGLFSKHPD
eukprot:Platyproteum_vivax@DN9694_c0_g1_i1.p1